MTPLSPAQRRSWLLDQLGFPRQVAAALHITGPLAPDTLTRALHDVVARHDVLHSVFVADETGEPHQRTERGFRLPVATTMADILDRRFDLTEETPMRVALVRSAPDEHTLVLVIHCIAADESSLAVLTDELLTAYDCRTRDEAPRWATKPTQSAPPSDQDTVPTGGPNPLPLPTDRPRPPEPSLRADTVRFVLAPDLVAAVARLAQRHGTTTPTVLRAALAVLLHQLGSGTDVPIGSVGAQIAVCHLDLSGNPGFTEVLRATPATGPPFKDPARSLTHHPLCQVVFGWRAATPPVRQVAGLTVTVARVPTGTPFDLTFTFTAGDEIAGEIEYAVDLFDRTTVTAMADRYIRVLRQVTADPDARIGGVNVLSPAERTLLTAVNRTAPPVAGVTVPELVWPQVAAAPDAVAVVCGDQSLTYRQVWQRAQRLARALADAGVGMESLVGLALPRTADLVVAMLGVLMSGAAYVPIDPRYPSQRLAFLLADAKPALLLTDSATQPALPDHDIPRCLLDTLDLAAADEPDVPLRPDNLAYVMYTSGSTGTPKGVAVTHAMVANGVTHLAGVVGLRPGSRMLAATSINFDVSVFEIITALASGAVVEIVRDVLEIGERGGWCGSVLHTVPSVFTDVVSDAIRVDTAVFAGEPLPATLARQVRETGARVINAYGQTESFYATTHTVLGDPVTVPIGTPLGGMRAYVLNPTLSPLPPGVTGELYVGGMVARGYHDRPALTAQRFVPDPFGSPGSRMYRTGDLASLKATGDLEHRGRADTQLKIHGIRIEPAEIENVLVTHPDIAQAVAAPRGKRLVAYVVPADPGAELDPRRLRRFVADRLPAFLIPASFVVLDRLPLAANGKLDLSRLPDPRPTRRARPSTERERGLALLFADVLGRATVEAHDDFFALGGDSRQAIHLARQVRAEFGVELPVREFLRTPTVAAIDDYLTREVPDARFDD